MPGQKKRVWRGVLNWPIWGHTQGNTHYLSTQLPDNEPGREIEIGISKEQAAIVGLALLQWSAE